MKKKSYARETANKNLIRASTLLLILFILAVFIGLYIAWMFSFRDRIFLLSGIVIGVILYHMLLKILQSKFLPRWGKYKGFRQGEAGEETVTEALKQNLGKGNLIIADVVLEENMGNIDHIIIGQYGVFVIETKTHRGRIVCEGDTWFQYKKIGERTLPVKLTQSPSIQARSNAARLNSFLSENYPKLSKEWVKAIVIFPNKQSEGDYIVIKNPPQDCKVYESVDKMIDGMKKEIASINMTPDDLSQLENIFMLRSLDTTIIN
jgi:hypothetical protein